MLSNLPKPTRRQPIRLLLLLAAGGALGFGGFASASSGHFGTPTNGQLSKKLASALVRDVAGQSWAASGYARMLVPQRHAANSQPFIDPAGDSGNAPDITSVTVSNDDAGLITFAATLANRASLGSDDMVLIMLDVDRNPSTGNNGFDDAIGVTPVGPLHLGWNGSDLVLANSPTLTAGVSGGQLTVRINRSDLRGTSGFVFALGTTGDGAATVSETAGPWTYQLVLGTPTTSTTTPPPTITTPPPTTTPSTPAAPPKVALLIGSAKTTPARAVAGKRFTVTFLVTFRKEEQATSVEISTGQTRTGTLISWSPVPSGKMVCDPSVAGKVIAHTESFKNSQARLSFVIPKTAKAKLLRVKVKITATETKTARTVSATKIATFAVR